MDNEVEMAERGQEFPGQCGELPSPLWESSLAH